VGAGAVVVGGYVDGDEVLAAAVALRDQRIDSLTQTLFLCKALRRRVVIAVSVAVAYFSAPSAENARTAESYGLRFEPPVETSTRHSKPGEWLEYSPYSTY